jgi:hypothetical protein
VSSSGSFSASGVVSSYAAFGVTTITTSAVHGKFSGSKKASGTVTFEQRLSGKATGTCNSSALAFKAKA